MDSKGAAVREISAYGLSMETSHNVGTSTAAQKAYAVTWAYRVARATRVLVGLPVSKIRQ
eukprot:CAMPEP_0179071462 /NCGR_PEP_ID=MMETSP0796-20121207/31544_1 /TAXON_ID=73915 /ORGANISM="Pyrodinium bahamense, Strain pbaha01" /LENGTH=59 /DNA_ID=CAMNT_0020768577 /DNA_START=220 /DNA_END=399 /DNA_ORIENTATION=+